MEGQHGAICCKCNAGAGRHAESSCSRLVDNTAGLLRDDHGKRDHFAPEECGVEDGVRRRVRPGNVVARASVEGSLCR